jgi:hypothetical protein
MPPTRLVECLKLLHWSTATLAEALECDEELVEAWVLGLEDIPMKAGVWIDVLARMHTAAEPQRPTSLKGKTFEPTDEALSAKLEHIPDAAYDLLRRLGQGPVPISSLHGTEDESLVDFVVSRELAERQGDNLVITAAGKDIGEMEPGSKDEPSQ